VKREVKREEEDFIKSEEDLVDSVIISVIKPEKDFIKSENNDDTS